MTTPENDNAGLLDAHPEQWRPAVDDHLVPVVGRQFKTLSEGVLFYMKYARLSGFDVRKSSTKRDRHGVTYMRYLLCSRQGVKGGGRLERGPECSNGKTRERRRRISNRVKCKAKICLRKHSSGEFIVSVFVEEHTHQLCSESSKQFLRLNRGLDVAQQAFLGNCIKANIGGSKSLRLCKEMTGSYANVGATNVEFQNFRRDLQMYVDVGDGEMIIEKFKIQKEVCNEFFYEYHLDDEGRLARLFWADPTGRRAFSCYGDIISFDATYGTNRYSMVFVPFTGVDNHKRCITFAAGLLTKEDVDSYSWLLEKFKCAMGKTPSCVVTDQDPAMRIAIKQVLSECLHRFCMWHIMTKVNEKLGSELAKDEKFRTRLNGIVWNERLHTTEFELQWQKLMDDYKLSDHRWFCKLYTERESWIPAYFADLPMSGLLRTTSRSEAENGVYGKFTRPHSSLVEFYMQFESVLEMQRYRQAKLNAECEGYLPEFKTPLALERHVAQLFTITIFYEIQKEIEAACFYCYVVGIREDGGGIHYDIKGECNTIFTVHHEPNVQNTSCSCKLFQRIGLVCRHMFLVFRVAELETLPSKYIMKRWCKHLTCGECSAETSTSGRPASGAIQLWAEINACVGLVGNSTEREARMVEVLKGLIMEFANDGGTMDPITGNRAAIQALCGVQPPQIITIKAPAQAKNKGTGKRIKSSRELAIEKSVKIGRKCGICGKYAHHNARSCPLK
ncbi:PREDICTED: protein FAR1-RELATED SEQUENCE 5-like [Ipomoea nil]|uniref:protein FAR1-RELATED SEQUENCE 5-like n=1 Tax=Ipomoea nil TaxID=35883 RepID=UPI0009016C00|nr:PREDICTED: protein FAR1-RELATED SEQUENCE 5-like [Ipomoea nil]XP_019157187.1 PREDICTED: protein FAR1-RELATED SEQUENCE 5-like [Ipomoea nil]